jgi:pyruvate dehydrogenase E1 component
LATQGTDGFGMSDTRGALRRHFLVDAESIVCRTLLSLAERGEIERTVVRAALDKYRLWDPMAAEAGSTEGGG